MLETPSAALWSSRCEPQHSRAHSYLSYLLIHLIFIWYSSDIHLIFIWFWFAIDTNGTSNHASPRPGRGNSGCSRKDRAVEGAAPWLHGFGADAERLCGSLWLCAFRKDLSTLSIANVRSNCGLEVSLWMLTKKCPFAKKTSWRFFLRLASLLWFLLLRYGRSFKRFHATWMNKG